MKLEHYPINKLKKEIKAIISKYLDINHYKIFFFGSRVNGKSNERSDIDIGIEGKNPVPIEILARIKSDLEDLPVLYKFDIVDLKSTTESFKKFALEKTEQI